MQREIGAAAVSRLVVVGTFTATWPRRVVEEDPKGWPRVVSEVALVWSDGVEADGAMRCWVLGAASPTSWYEIEAEDPARRRWVLEPAAPMWSYEVEAERPARIRWVLEAAAPTCSYGIKSELLARRRAGSSERPRRRGGAGSVRKRSGREERG